MALLCTSSSRVLLDGVAGDPIKHGRGLRQGTLSHLFSSFWPLILYIIFSAKQPIKIASKGSVEESLQSAHPYMPMTPLSSWPQLRTISTSLHPLCTNLGMLPGLLPIAQKAKWDLILITSSMLFCVMLAS
jgi:hypothetical protein